MKKYITMREFTADWLKEDRKYFKTVQDNKKRKLNLMINDKRNILMEEYNLISEYKERRGMEFVKAKGKHREKIKGYVLKEIRKRRNCRTAVLYALKIGKLKKESCKVCNIPEVEAHHPDYNKPLYVKWLCHDDHKKEHNRLYLEQKQSVTNN